MVIDEGKYKQKFIECCSKQIDCKILRVRAGKLEGKNVGKSISYCVSIFTKIYQLFFTKLLTIFQFNRTMIYVLFYKYQIIIKQQIYFNQSQQQNMKEYNNKHQLIIRTEDQIYSHRTYKIQDSQNHNTGEYQVDQRIEEIKRKYTTPSRKVNQNKLNSQSHKKDALKDYNNLDNIGLTSLPLNQLRNTQHIKIQRPQQLSFRNITELKHYYSPINQRQPIKNQSQYLKPEKYQPRLQNIERINNKIKSVFNQKQLIISQKQSFNCSFDNTASKKQSPYHKLEIDELKTSDLKFKRQKMQSQITKVKKQQIRESYLQRQKGSNFEDEQSRSLLEKLCKDNSKSKRYLGSVKDQLNSIRQPRQQNQLFKRKQEVKQGKKNIDIEISKIQEKIREFQNEKKKLNIQFKPYNFHHQKSINKKRINSQERKLFNYPLLNQNQTKDNSLFYRDRSISNIQDTQRNNQTYRHIQKPPLPKKTQNPYKTPQPKQLQVNPVKSNVSEFKIKLFKVQDNEIIVDKQKERFSYKDEDSMANKQLMKKLNNQMQMRKGMIDGMQERKKKLKTINDNEVSFRTSHEVKKLVTAFKEQVQLDQHLRNGKIWIQSRLQSNKWEKLSQQLQNLKIMKSQKQVEKQFTPSMEENNPFFTLQNCEETYKSLSEKYKAAKEHWQQHIIRKFNRGELSAQKFYNKSIDLQKKGYFVLEDLVRFLNMETGTFFRNRDLYLIFKRITKAQKGNFQNIVNILCH